MGRHKKTDGPGISQIVSIWPSQAVATVPADPAAVRYSVGVIGRTEPKGGTYACTEKADWTQNLGAVRWWSSEKEARSACVEAMEKARARSWYGNVEWVVEDEEAVKKRLNGLPGLP